jgi:hypothetical protein
MCQHDTHAGDLDRRVTTRRRAIGPIRQQLAARAEMAIAHLAYLEESPAMVGHDSPMWRAASLVRRADALETTVDAPLRSARNRPVHSMNSPLHAA